MKASVFPFIRKIPDDGFGYATMLGGFKPTSVEDSMFSKTPGYLQFLYQNKVSAAKRNLLSFDSYRIDNRRNYKRCQSFFPIDRHIAN